MNSLAFNPLWLIGELAVLALIVALTLVEILHKTPLFALSTSEALTRRSQTTHRVALAGMGLVVLLLFFLGIGRIEFTQIIFSQSLKVSGGNYIGKLALAGATLLVMFLSPRYLSSQAIPAADYYLLLLFSLLGAFTLISAEHFVVIFLALEMMSIPLYALVALHRYKSRAGESAIKYLLLGGFSSAFLLFGISLLYGVTGSLEVQEVINRLANINPEVASNASFFSAQLGLLLILTGLAFKVSLFPFHAWTPDVYEGASTPLVAYMSVVVKVSAFAVMLRIFANSVPFTLFDARLSQVLTVIALLTVIYGNSVALVQKNIKRMLAYSSIAHAGYMALAIAPMQHTVDAVQAVLFYGISYLAMNILAFGILIYLTQKEVYCENLSDLKGLAKTQPIPAAMLALAMLSLAGIPPAIGFVAKLQIFLQLIRAEMYWTAVLALLASLVALYFYLNVIMQMYMRESETPAFKSDPTGKLTANITLWLATAFTLIFGIVPAPVLQWSLDWAESLFSNML